ncbi:MAG: transposase family protein [Okeania sp. SIO2H7]|nr:transposase family protein [Okeania sp. SIO2H7]
MHDYLGLMFKVTESTANNYFHYWIKVLNDALPPSLIEQAKTSEIWSDNLSDFLSQSELIVDSLEQPRPRPVEYQEQKKCPER